MFVPPDRLVQQRLIDRVQPLDIQVEIVGHERRRLHLLHGSCIQEVGQPGGGGELDLRPIRQSQPEVDPISRRFQHRKLGQLGLRARG